MQNSITPVSYSDESPVIGFNLSQTNTYQKISRDKTPGWHGSGYGAENMEQKIFIWLHKKRFYTWCVKVGYNVCIDHICKEKVATRSTQYLTLQSKDSAFKFSPDTIGLNNLVNRLDEFEKEVIDFAYYKGYTHQEISDVMQIPMGTVKTRLSRAITKLRKHFIEINQNLLCFNKERADHDDQPS